MPACGGPMGGDLEFECLEGLERLARRCLATLSPNAGPCQPPSQVLRQVTQAHRLLQDDRGIVEALESGWHGGSLFEASLRWDLSLRELPCQTTCTPVPRG